MRLPTDAEQDREMLLANSPVVKAHRMRALGPLRAAGPQPAKDSTPFRLSTSSR
jgi:hypothetical protein